MSFESPPMVTVTIATHNRRDDLRTTLGQLAILDPAPDEILITADGCTDDTATMVREKFPHCRLIENSPGLGSIASRDRMIREASHELVLSLDDDSFPVEPDFLVRMTREFDAQPKLGVLTFPQRTDEFPESLTQTDFGPPLRVGSYVNSGAALRRSVYLSLPGFPTEFFHAYEEPDFALQCNCAGYYVLLFPGLTIRHRYTTQSRSELRTHAFHARNEAWSVILRCPLTYLIPVLTFRALRQFGYACSRGPAWVIREPIWWWRFWQGLPAILKKRNPVAWSEYRKWMQLVRNPTPCENQQNA